MNESPNIFRACPSAARTGKRIDSLARGANRMRFDEDALLQADARGGVSGVHAAQRPAPEGGRPTDDRPVAESKEDGALWLTAARWRAAGRNTLAARKREFRSVGIARARAQYERDTQAATEFCARFLATAASGLRRCAVSRDEGRAHATCVHTRRESRLCASLLRWASLAPARDVRAAARALRAAAGSAATATRQFSTRRSRARAAAHSVAKARADAATCIAAHNRRAFDTRSGHAARCRGPRRRCCSRAWTWPARGCVDCALRSSAGRVRAENAIASHAVCESKGLRARARSESGRTRRERRRRQAPRTRTHAYGCQLPLGTPLPPRRAALFLLVLWQISRSPGSRARGRARSRRRLRVRRDNAPRDRVPSTTQRRTPARCRGARLHESARRRTAWRSPARAGGLAAERLRPRGTVSGARQNEFVRPEVGGGSSAQLPKQRRQDQDATERRGAPVRVCARGLEQEPPLMTSAPAGDATAKTPAAPTPEPTCRPNALPCALEHVADIRARIDAPQCRTYVAGAEDSRASVARPRRRLVFFLDYDGTLSPIVSNPERAFMRDDTRTALRALSRTYVTAVVSGRALEKVRRLVGLDDLVYAGSHGFDIDGPQGTSMSHTVGEEWRPKLEHAMDVFRERILPLYPGSSLEDNKYAVSVHFRNCTFEDAADVGDTTPSAGGDRPTAVRSPDTLAHAVDAIVSELGLRRTNGKMVYEIRPRLDWHKGKAVEYLLHILGLDGDDVLPVYIGDDVTDEDAFQSLRRRDGIAVIVATPDVNRDTAAHYRLDGVPDVTAFLQKFVDEPVGDTLEPNAADDAAVAPAGNGMAKRADEDADEEERASTSSSATTGAPPAAGIHVPPPPSPGSAS